MLITQPERAEYRAALSEMKLLREKVESHIAGREVLDPKMLALIEQMTGASDIRNQLRALDSTYEDFDAQYDERLRHAAEYRFSPFCEYMFRDEVPAQHHEFLIDHMEAVYHGDIKRLAISMPPGAAKSSYASHRFGAWYLGQRPDHRWLQGAHTMTFAKDRLGKVVRGMMGEDRFKGIFPEVRLSASSSAADYFEFAGHRGYYKAVGCGYRYRRISFRDRGH